MGLGCAEVCRRQKIVQVPRDQLHINLAIESTAEIEARVWHDQEGLSKVDGVFSTVIVGQDPPTHRHAVSSRRDAEVSLSPVSSRAFCTQITLSFYESGDGAVVAQPLSR